MGLDVAGAALAVQQMSCAWRASSPLPIGDRHLGLRRLGAPTCSPMELQPSTVVERSCKASGAATGLPASPRHPEHARVTLHGRQRAAGTLAMRSAEFGASLRHGAILAAYQVDGGVGDATSHCVERDSAYLQ